MFKVQFTIFTFLTIATNTVLGKDSLADRLNETDSTTAALLYTINQKTIELADVSANVEGLLAFHRAVSSETGKLLINALAELKDLSDNDKQTLLKKLAGNLETPEISKNLIALKEAIAKQKQLNIEIDMLSQLATKYFVNHVQMNPTAQTNILGTNAAQAGDLKVNPTELNPSSANSDISAPKKYGIHD